jgi:Uma2 family endonuclease
MHTTVARLKQPNRTPRRRVRIGPEDHGRRMTLADFSRAEAAPGYLYELANGVIEVSELPDVRHAQTVHRLNRQLWVFELAHPGIIEMMGGGGEAKIEMYAAQSERHPDISIYLTPPPEGIKQPWDRWVPDIAIEVVSETSAKRDYEDKRREYLAAGVREYWIVDPRTRSALFLVRRADEWEEQRVGARGKWRTSLLPGFTLELARVFEAASRRK